MDNGLRVSGMQALQRGGRLRGDPGAGGPVQPDRAGRSRRPPPVQCIVYAAILRRPQAVYCQHSIHSYWLSLPTAQGGFSTIGMSRVWLIWQK